MGKGVYDGPHTPDPLGCSSEGTQPLLSLLHFPLSDRATPVLSVLTAQTVPPLTTVWRAFPALLVGEDLVFTVIYRSVEEPDHGKPQE